VTVASATLASRPVALRPVLIVFLPFAAGYYLTHLFRTINALIANRLMADFGLGAADLGVLTSVFFLSFAAIQLPLGILLDRYGPRRVQITLLPIAGLGAALFAAAECFTSLAISRALIGIGVAGSLMSGLKAIILRFSARACAARQWLLRHARRPGGGDGDCACRNTLNRDWLARPVRVACHRERGVRVDRLSRGPRNAGAPRLVAGLR
jgi:hypothetical protein